MAASRHFLRTSISACFLMILLHSEMSSSVIRVAAFPRIKPPCGVSGGCPNYDVIKVENGYEIRRYNSPLWMSTSPIQDTSLVQASNNAFLQLFAYIQGNNANNQRMEMTAPVITQVTPNNNHGPSSFVTSFYVPIKSPPSAEGLRVQKWGPMYAAVRQFGGFVDDSNYANEAEALKTSLKGSTWLDAITKSHPHSPMDYVVAQYNSPFEQDNRVNEIWMMFKM